MEIQQHYLLNLKRRPERLYGWAGAQYQRGFDFEKLTVLEVIDGSKYKTLKHLFERFYDYFYQNGIDYKKECLEQNEIPVKQGKRGIRASMLTKLVLFLHLEKEAKPEHFFMIWEDDIILRQPYNDWIAVECPEDATMIAFHTPISMDHLEKHLTLPFRYGAAIHKSNQAFVFNKEGLLTILDLYRETQTVADLELFLHQHNDLPGLYSSEVNYMGEMNFEGAVSDISIEPKRRDRNIPRFKTFSASNVFRSN